MNQTLVVPLGWALLHFLWQGALIAMLLAVLNAALRRASANTRYLTACGALALMLVAAGGTFLWLGSEVSESPAAAGPAPSGAHYAVAPGNPAGVAAAGLETRLADYFPWLVGIWFAGVLALSVRSAGGWVMAQRLKARNVVPAEAPWEQRLRRLEARLNIARPVRLCKSAAAQVPTVVGWLRPVILVPVSAFAGLDARQLEALLAHELAHIRRHDYLVNLIQTAAETLLFYHPAVWWVGQRIRTEREHCCDDLAVAACGDVAVYARALTAIEEMRGGASQFAMAADGGVLLARIRRLIGVPAGVHNGKACLAGLLAVLMALALWAGTQARPAAAAVGTGFSALPSVAPETERENPPARETAPPQKSGGFVSGMAGAGYRDLDPDQLIAFKIHGVTPEYIGELRAAGMTNLTPDQLVAFRIHGVDAKAIAELRAAGFGELTPDGLVALRVHDITPDFAKQMKAVGIGEPSLDQLVAMKIHGVSPDFAKQMKALGIGQPSGDQLVSMKIHGVTPEFAAEMKGLALGSLSFDELVAFRIHGVNASKVSEFQSLGLGKLTPDAVVALQIHNVTPEFVRSLKEAGVSRLSSDDAVAASIHGINSNFIREARRRGLKNPTIDQLVELKLGGSAPADEII